MKKISAKILSLFLAICLVIPMALVFAPVEAQAEDSSEEGDNLNVIFNRTFSEGWDYTNGIGGVANGGRFSIDYTAGYDLNYNYYWRLEATDAASNQYSSLSMPEKIDSGKLFIELDVSAIAGCGANGLLQTVTYGSGSDRAFNQVLMIKDGKLQFNGIDLCTVNEQWVHVTLIVNWSYAEEAGISLSPGDQVPYSVDCIVIGESGEAQRYSAVYNAGNGGPGFQELRIGFAGGRAADTVGHWIGIDNLKIYSGVDEVTELPADNFGSKVNTGAAKTIEILGGSGVGATVSDYLNGALIMKTGVDYALLEEQRVPIMQTEDGVAFGAPKVVNGVTVVPLNTILDYVGYPKYIHPDGLSYDISTGTSASYITVGRNSATVAGERVELTLAPGYVGEGETEYLAIALDDVETLFRGYYVTYDELGLICIAEADDLFHRDTDSEMMMTIMKQFVFDYASPETVYELAKENTDNFTHPYLFANSETFDFLREAYNKEEGDEGYNEFLKKTITTFVNGGINSYHGYAEVDSDGNYVGVKEDHIPVNTNETPDGYDPYGGRHSTPTGILVNLAFAYQMTLNTDYAHLAYDYIVLLGQWDHWGPGHFLNCADASAPIAQTIDWIYPGILELGLDPAGVMDALYKNGVHMGYLASIEEALCPWPSPLVGNGGFVYHKKLNNWNAVCASGMIQASLVILSDERYVGEATALISDNMYYLAQYGLGQYMPDGSYIESASYWAYGTNNYFEMCAALDRACGTNFGFMDCWGMDKTCYFATHVEDNDRQTMAYHDGGVGTLDTSFFCYVAEAIDDYGLYKIRMNQVNTGKSRTLFDLLYYVPEEELPEANLDLQYHMVGMDGYTARSSWESGATFVGIMGGYNACAHGQVDSGAFVYHNMGVVWFYDLGGDNYNLPNYFGNNKYYRKNAEGNNTLAITSVPASLPFGQDKAGTGKIYATGSNDFGSYVLIDNANVYGKYVNYARRGMMMTNDRKTVIIQDEVALTAVHSVLWSGHYNTSSVIDVKLSSDGRTAYMYSKKANEDGDPYVLRISIVSNYKSFKFELMDCYTFLLENTYVEPEDAAEGHKENSRESFRKLVIKGTDVMSFNLAIAIELVEDETDAKEVGYKWTLMDNWVPYADTREGGAEQEEVLVRDANPRRAQILSSYQMAKRLYDNNNVYAEKVSDIYRILTDYSYIMLKYKDDNLGANYDEAVNGCKAYIAEYDAFAAALNNRNLDNIKMAKSLLGW